MFTDLILRFSLLLLLAASAWGQSLAARVLVVYNSHPTYVTDSLSVANHYQSLRGIPAGNLCGVSFANPEEITQSAWTSAQRGAVRACLDAVGRTNILYIVMAYNTPFRLVRPTPYAYASLDSYIADIWDAYSSSYFWSSPSATHRYFVNAQTSGNVYAPFQSFASFRAQSRQVLTYSVFRLDGATAQAARDLVTRAVAAEAAGGLAATPGTVYIDRRYNDLSVLGDLGLFSGDHDLERAALMSAAAGLTVVKDTNDAEIGFAPAPLTAPDAMLYSGWYQYLNYNDVFTWKPGAVGWHLDSASALHIRSGNSWVARALSRNITVTSGSVNEPFLEGLARPDIVFRHLLQGGNVGDAFHRGTAWLRWMVVHVGDPLYVPFPGGRAPWNNPGFTEASLSVSPRELISNPGATINVTVTLANAAPPGGQSVTLYNNWAPFFVTALPTTVTVPAGQRSVSAALSVTNPIPNPNDNIGVLITATTTGATLQNTAYIASLFQPLSAPNSLANGATAQGAVILNELAPLGGRVITLSSSNTGVLQVPASVTVPAGAMVAVFPINATGLGTATISATFGPYLTTKSVTVNP